MRKGDDRKIEILQAAERLFCQKGYTETSVQDILDALNLSKGSFYHHYESKAAVLEGICQYHATKMAADCDRSVLGVADPIARLNCVLHNLSPLRREESQLMAMLLPLMFAGEGRAVTMSFQSALQQMFRPLIRREIENAVSAGVLYLPGRKDMTEPVIAITCLCWQEMCRMLMSCIEKAQRPEPAVLLENLNIYRYALERLLDAPFGTLEIISLEEWYETAQMMERRTVL